MEVNFHASSAYLLHCRNGILKMSKNLPFCEGTEQQRTDAFYSYIFCGRHNYNNDKEKTKKMNERKKRKRKKHPPQQLPQDILSEIIVRLPGTKILKLSSICKDWYTMSRDSFITTRRALLQTNNNKAYIAIHRGVRGNNRLDLIEGNDVIPLKPLSKHTAIIGSSNGILCCLKMDYNVRPFRENLKVAWGNSLDVYVIGGGNLYLYNPLLGGRHCRLPLPEVPIEVPELPEVPIEVPELSSLLIKYIEFPKLSSLLIKYGFGFDSIRSEFKVVRFVVRLGYPLLIVQTCVVPMLEKSIIGTPQPWKTINLDRHIKNRFDCCHQGDPHEPLTLVNGKLHFFQKSRIISFDIVSEEILVLEDIFSFEGGNTNILRIGELGGRLFATTTQYSRNDCFDIWVIKDYGDPKSWTILLSMRQLSISPQAPFMIPYQLFNKDGDELLLIVYSLHTYMVPHAPTVVSLPPHPQNKLMFQK